MQPGDFFNPYTNHLGQPHNCNSSVQQNFAPNSYPRIINHSFIEPGQYYVAFAYPPSYSQPNGDTRGQNQNPSGAGHQAQASPNVPSQMGSATLADYPPEVTLLSRPCPSCLNGKLRPHAVVNRGVDRHGFQILLTQPTHWECIICHVRIP